MFYKEMVVYADWMPELYRMQREVLGLYEDEVIKLPYAPYVHGECIDFESEEGLILKILNKIKHFYTINILYNLLRASTH